MFPRIVLVIYVDWFSRVTWFLPCACTKQCVFQYPPLDDVSQCVTWGLVSNLSPQTPQSWRRGCHFVYRVDPKLRCRKIRLLKAPKPKQERVIYNDGRNERVSQRLNRKFRENIAEMVQFEHAHYYHENKLSCACFCPRVFEQPAIN